MNYKIGQKLDKWTFLVKQEYLVTWSQVLNDPNPIHLDNKKVEELGCLLYTSPSPRDISGSRMPSSA